MDNIKKLYWKLKTGLKTFYWTGKSFLRRIYNLFKYTINMSPQTRQKIKIAKAKKKSIMSGDFSIIENIKPNKLEYIAEVLLKQNKSLSKSKNIKDVFGKVKVPVYIPLKLFYKNDKLYIISELEEDQIENIYSQKLYDIDSLKNNIDYYVMLIGKLNLDLNIIIKSLNDKKENIHTQIVPVKKEFKLDVVEGAKNIILGLRVKGSGIAAFDNISLLHKKSIIDFIRDYLNNKTTIVSNLYPSDENIYRNMFVHSRRMEYKNKGFEPNVLVVNYFSGFELRKFDGVNVLEVDEELLKEALNNVDKAKLCIHFLTENMWHGIKDNLNKLSLIVWIHGAEIQAWWRRAYLHETQEAIDAEKANFEKRKLFWKDILNNKNFENIHFVFVSNYLKNGAIEDYDINLPESNYSIINNYIDTNKFNYIKKPVEQRKKMLTIKSFATKTYANDITQKAIVELSKNKIFDDLEFAIYGDGARFEEDTKDLINFKNVSINRKFLTRDEIAALHKEYGVYIGTSRMDSQGVSRDEAMSSGLVPIANAVAAIPEFVDENCGILVDAEDYMGVADAIIKLYNEPELFEKLSQAAAERVRSQSGFEQTISKEIELIKSK
ncbi:MAG: glycosyltransferase family 4 protein [Christensenellaceae bacterium]|nr:glycosyltransferase family 4 protein [Christensenellaceae bacterium]